ncbi:MAG: cytochrome b/b6 domain-containing protein [Chloroherpetonaceae bacterium]|nr:cytochrome b/b6 domain-containing protein [bacterium]
MRKIYLYPIWLRIWHFLNALLMLLLILSGISLHFSATSSFLFPFKTGMLIHNISGIVLTLAYLFYFVLNITSGNIKYYFPVIKGFIGNLWTQGKYYLLGIFGRERHPFHTDEKHKFNPLQQITYLGVMYFLVPFIIISGWALLFPELAPDEFLGMGGIWPMALLHTILGFLVTIFMIGHIYLGTTGEDPLEYFKTIITGYHIDHEEPEVVVIKEEKKKDKSPTLPLIFYNPITITGAIIAIITFLAIVFLAVVDFFSEDTNPYSGIINYVVLPAVLILGLILIAIGAIRENRRILHGKDRKEKLPVINLNKPKQQVAFLIFLVGTIVLVISTIFGSFQAYHYTDSDEFCGTLCHTVMQPEYTAYKNSPHARVHCVDCHIGSGATWYVRSKFSGAYQVYATIMNIYPKPIKTPIHNLRPSPETCEQCHWPTKFYSEKNISFDFYTSDEKNSEYKLSMLLKTGGGTVELGNNSGIHWKMYLENEISYYATDERRQDIPWVRVRNRQTGAETFYASTDSKVKVTNEMIKSGQVRTFDCIDCHNRPTHIYNVPNKIVNSYISNNRIDRSIPYIKNIAVQALESKTVKQNASYSDIRDFIMNFYQQAYPDVISTKRNELEQAITSTADIFSKNYFPNMKVSWRAHPNNIGHMYAKGCFRCHDGKHVSPEGKVITNDCNACHTIIYQKPAYQTETIGTNLAFVHPGGIDKLVQTRICSDCHASQTFSKQTVIKK